MGLFITRVMFGLHFEITWTIKLTYLVPACIHSKRTDNAIIFPSQLYGQAFWTGNHLLPRHLCRVLGEKRVENTANYSKHVSAERVAARLSQGVEDRCSQINNIPPYMGRIPSQLYGHLRRMEEERIPLKVWNQHREIKKEGHVRNGFPTFTWKWSGEISTKQI
ncbi:hypothetical protein J6590_027151 [Homalodisca vitripennis]|nr:hypothetical protein J6590_027151 [Homalodisca vitripennis]